IDLALPRRDAKALAPGADVGGVHRAMRKPAGAAVIVPSPERGVLHLELHGPAQALACNNRAAREFPGFHLVPRCRRAAMARSGSGTVLQQLQSLNSAQLRVVVPSDSCRGCCATEDTRPEPRDSCNAAKQRARVTV